MQEQSVWSYVGFGTALRYLQDAAVGWPIHEADHVIDNLKWLLRDLDSLGLVVTSNVASNESLYGLLEDLEARELDALLTVEDATKLRSAVTVVRKTLMGETAEKKAFVTSAKRWDVAKLLHDPGAMFGAGVYVQLDSHSAFDFKEASKCVAFELPTAAAFHLMRGTEAVLRTFYCHIVRQKRLPKERRMWGPMLDQLRARTKPPPKALLDNLDAIRHNFRNPTQHPDEVYSIDGAQDLFGLVVPAVNQMVNLTNP